ncbi:MAG TPA: carbohydrate ABC transporter permease [Thermotoga sp.]|nr:carbohydrate ABC transporter permease [Thermotoga sp.]
MRSSLIEKVVLSIICAFVFVIFIFPLFWTFSMSIRNPQEVFSYPPRLWPKNPTFANYKTVVLETDIPKYFLNSMILVLISVILVLIISIPSAYGLSRFSFRISSILIPILLVVQMVPSILISITFFKYSRILGIYNSLTFLSMTIAAYRSPFITWLLKSFFDTIPRELEEAALIDGCTRLGALRRIFLPLATPGIATAVIFTSIFAWGDFVFPFIMIDDYNKFPVTVGIFAYTEAKYQVTTHLVATGAFLMVIPALIVFLLLQKYVVEALTAGAIKG